MVVNGPEGLLKNERNSHAGLAGPGNVPASPPSPPILSPRGMRRLKGQDSGGDSRQGSDKRGPDSERSCPPRASQGAEKGQSHVTGQRGLECPRRRQVYGHGNGRQAPGSCPATPVSSGFRLGCCLWPWDRKDQHRYPLRTD